MGARQSKRSIDISGDNPTSNDNQLEGRLEKLEEGSENSPGDGDTKANSDPVGETNEGKAPEAQVGMV